MSDEHHQDTSHSSSRPSGPEKVTHGAGHEVDAPPTRELFNIIWGLGGLTLLSIATCAQLFYRQGRELEEERGKVVSYQLAEYRKEMSDRVNGSGVVEFKDGTGATVRQKFKPLELARVDVLQKPDLLKASAPPAGWVHPDDIAAGGQGGAAPADQAVGAAAAPNPGGVVPPGTADPAAGVAPSPGAPSGSGADHPLGEPAVLPAGTGPADPTSAEPIRQPPVQPPPATPSIPPVNPAPAPAPPTK
ncbi:MAG: hypothetical protein JNL82_18015 [Myxococcales bacterium]|nr:hypothetical protein [Myxococcales bacterium]